jgi:predicted lipoprotein with Yx(FWY)xxD motif
LREGGLHRDRRRLLLPKLLIIAVACAGMLVAGCGGDDDSDDSASTNGDTTEAAAAGGGYGSQGAGGGASAEGSTIQLSDSQFGQILFGENDQAIYLFDKESGPKSECYGACAEAWPPVLTQGEPQAGDGVKASRLGTTERTDGTTQVTYNGHPLYYYAHEGPGEVTCHNVEEFGGLWLVVDAAGDAV